MSHPLHDFYTTDDDPQQSDAQALAFIEYLMGGARLGHVAMLHSAGMKAGCLVNGRVNIHPITFPQEVGHE